MYACQAVRFLALRRSIPEVCGEDPQLGNVLAVSRRIVRIQVLSHQGMIFPPHMGGKRQNGVLFPPPPYPRGMGGKSSCSPPHIREAWGEITAISPPHGGGGEIEKILRNQPPRLSIFLKKIVFPCSKLSKFSPAAR